MRHHRPTIRPCGHSVPYAGHPHLGDPIVETVVPSPPRSTRTTSHPNRLWLVRWSRVVYPLLESRPPHANSTPTPCPINQTRFRHTPPPSGQVSAALKGAGQTLQTCRLTRGRHAPNARAPRLPRVDKHGAQGPWQGCQGQMPAPNGVQASTCTIVIVRI